MRTSLVENHDDTRNVLCRLLGNRGREVYGGLGEARVISAEEVPELLMCDIGLSDGDGCHLLRELRTRLPSLKAAAFTGSVYATDQARYREAGFGWFLAKPAGVKEIFAVVEAAQSNVTA